MSNLSELLPSGGGQNLVEFVASGTLPNGKPVILNSNGTVTVVAGSGSAESIPNGVEVTVTASGSEYMCLQFDPNIANKFILAYRDQDNSDACTAVVGTVSGGAITFGSEQVINTGGQNNHIDISFDPNTAGKFIVGYSLYVSAAATQYGYVVVCTYSGTTITAGTPAVFHSGTSTYIALSYDPNTANKFIVVFRGSSNYGQSKIGTVSGTSISYGSSQNFNSGTTERISISFDPNTSGKFVVGYKDSASTNRVTVRGASYTGTTVTYGTVAQPQTGAGQYTKVSYDLNTAGKFVLAFTNNADGDKGYSYICTQASNDSVTFGTAVIFESGQVYHMDLAFSTVANNFIVTYRDVGTSNNGTANVGVVSGTGITYGTKAVYNAGNSYDNRIAIDPNSAGHFAVGYMDYGAGGSAPSKAITGVINTLTTNLTSTNLIGITSEATSSGGTAKINTWGGINEAQTSLTIASDYYAQTNGTITTATAGQKLGTAISATTINMKDLT